jgi:hypothetical protein
MDAAALLSKLSIFAPLLEKVLMGLEPKAIEELKAAADQVQSPDLKLVLMAMIDALDVIAKAEIDKLS